MHIYTCIYAYIVLILMCISLSLSLYIYIYICKCRGMSSSISRIVVLCYIHEGLVDLVRRDELARLPVCFLRWTAQHL